MLRMVACILAVLVASLLAIPQAHAGSSADAALALGSFAVLNQLLRGDTVIHDILRGSHPSPGQTVVVHPPPPQVIYAPPPQMIYAPPPATVIYTPSHGHHHHQFVPPGHYKRHWKHGHYYRGHHKHYRHHH